MAAVASCRSLHLFSVVVVLAVSVGCVWSKSFTITNNCGYTVWPGVLPGAGSPALDSTGFELAPGQSRTLSAPAGWSGRLWGRTLCSTDGSTGRFACVTGDCGSGTQGCAGGSATPPATLAEFTLDGGGMDFYDVSVVDGYNLPVLVAPLGAAPGVGNCAPTGCVVDLNGACPADLRLRVTAASAPVPVPAGGVGCKSACEAFGSPQYCCRGEYGSPSACKPSAYSQFFKNACPRAYSYAFDDATSTFTCAGGDTAYTITFCPSTTSVKSSSSTNSQAPGDPPLINGTMTYTGGDQVGAAAARAARPPPHLVLLGATLVTLALAGALS